MPTASALGRIRQEDFCVRLRLAQGHVRVGVPIAVIKPHDQNPLGEKRFMSICSLQFILQGNQGRNSCQEPEARAQSRGRGGATYRLLPMACSASFLKQPRTTLHSPWVAPPTVSWAVPCQSIKKMPYRLVHRQTDGRCFSNENPSHRTLVGIKFTTSQRILTQIMKAEMAVRERGNGEGPGPGSSCTN